MCVQALALGKDEGRSTGRARETRTQQHPTPHSRVFSNVHASAHPEKERKNKRHWQGTRSEIATAWLTISRERHQNPISPYTTQDLSDCSLIIAVKEVPIEKLLPNRSYIFFSHTIKAQPYNMPLLDAILEKV